MEVLPELEPPFRTITGFTRSTIAGRRKEALHQSGRTELARDLRGQAGGLQDRFPGGGQPSGHPGARHGHLPLS